MGLLGSGVNGEYGIALLQLGRLDRALGDDIELFALHTLDHRLLRDEGQDGIPDVIHRHDGHELLFAARVVAEVVERRSLVTEAPIWDIDELQQMHLSGVCKYHDAVRVHAVQHIAVLRIGGLLVALVDALIDRAHVAEAVHQKYDRHCLDLLLLEYNFPGIFQHRAAWTAEFLFELVELFDDDLCHRAVVVQDICVAGDVF